MQIFNSLSRSIEPFTPLNAPHVSMYSCGPTVYDFTHIGHARKYTNDDLLKRTLTFLGYSVNHVMNITDVGHLESDDDEGEDKLEKGSRKYKKSVEDIIEHFSNHFIKSIDAVNIIRPNTLVRATEHIAPMIELIAQLERKGYTYATDNAVYFDTSKDDDYGKLSGQHVHDKTTSRKDVFQDPQKKAPADFVLWFKRVGRHAQHSMHWPSPWGEGFPGWHIECSAMSMKYLGSTIDIHTGGIDHVPVHHENEIAQSESATGQPFVHYWFHTAFLMVEGRKMSKSLGNIYTIDDIRSRGFDPITLRYLFLQTHYRQEMNFTWESLSAAQSALQSLQRLVLQLRSQTSRTQLSEDKRARTDTLVDAFTQALSRDLQLPQALAVVWETVKSNIPSEDKLDLMYSFDRVLGLGLTDYVEHDDVIPDSIMALAQQRQSARKAGNFAEADTIRVRIADEGYAILDEGDSFTIHKR